jgi:tetratricopeptide (TPR) repeat protein
MRTGLPPPLQATLARAVAAIGAGRAETALESLRTVIEGAPDHAATLRLVGIAERQRGHADAALQAFARAARLAPDDALIQGSLGGALAEAGRMDEAIAACRRACELAPGLAVAWNNLGKLLSDAGHLDASVAALERALAIEPSLLAARFSLAHAHAIGGDNARAAAAYRAILARVPDDGEAWMGLARLKSGALDVADIARLRALLDGAGLADGNRTALGFALAHALHDHGDTDAAFARFREANAAMRRRQPWDAAQSRARVDRILATPFASGGDADLGCETIFIVGMPRSGTTLIEQVLAAHPDVVALGESGALAATLAAESARRGVPYPDWAAGLAASDWRRLGRDYLERSRPPGAKRYTDKRPGNWLHLGAIAAMLPGARVVVARRDPLETCWSCYRQRFADGAQAFASDFDDLAAWWHDFDRTCRHHIAAGAPAIREQALERLQADPDREVRALLEFCGLDFAPGCLAPHEVRRPVRTLSAGQVRRPLARDTAVAARYGALLDPLRAALCTPHSGAVR